MTIARPLFIMLWVLAFVSTNRPVAAMEFDRSIGKQPVYQTKQPKYCLLVFGPQAQSAVWVVFDQEAQALYVDRNGNRDLTDPDERIQATMRTLKMRVSFQPGLIERQLPSFEVGTIRELASGIEHTDLKVDIDYSLITRPSFALQLEGNRPLFAGEMDLAFGDSPENAPILHLRGPLTLQAAPKDAGRLAFSVNGDLLPREEQRFTHGADSEFRVQLGTPGVGRGTFVSLPTDWVPGDLNPIAQIEFPGREDGQAPIRRTFMLKHRC